MRGFGFSDSGLRYDWASASAFRRTGARLSGERLSFQRRRKRLSSSIRLLAVVGTAAIGYCCAASADTLEWALVQAYQNNPSLNAQRAALRGRRECAAGAFRLSPETQCHCIGWL